MKIARFAAIAAVMLAVVGLPTLARAQDDFSVGEADPDLPLKIKAWNAECISCHSEQGVKNPPRQGMDLAKLATLVFDTAKFEGSVHSAAACKDCHGDAMAEYPHAKSVVKSCPDCHQGPAKTIVPEFQSTVHYKQHPGQFTCDSCHDAHAWKKSVKLGDLKAVVAQDNAMCRQCHSSDLQYAKFGITKKPKPLEEIHDWLPNPNNHWKHVRCIDCHTAERADGISHEILPKDQTQRHCVACHSTDSSLRVRLYRYLAEDERVKAAGFVNGFILNGAYVVGATRNPILDTLSFIVFGLLVAGLAGHGLIRIITGSLRKGRK